MKKPVFLPCLLILCLLLSACGGGAAPAPGAKPVPTLQAQPSGAEGEASVGSGTEEEPFLIRSEEELRLFAQRCIDNAYAKDDPYVSGCYRLERDIVLGDAEWTPITRFCGVFDGNGHSIGNLRFAAGESMYEGLFAELSGCVKNLTITDSEIVIHENRSGGAIIGNMTGGELLNCRVTASVSLEGPCDVGGLAGSISGEQLRVEGCSSAATVDSTGSVGTAGGIAARLDAEVKNCVNTGSVSAEGNAGGIAAVLGGHVEDCRNEGAVSGGHSAGGICYSFGDNALNHRMNDTTVSLIRCVNTGSVSAGRRDAGGICAMIRTGTIALCSNEGDVSSDAGYSGGVFGCFQISVFGEAAKELLISGCSNSGSVSGTGAWSCGGIGGNVDISFTAVVVEDCVNAGRVSAEGNASLGGILGAVHGTPQEEGSGSLRVTGSRNTGAIVGDRCECGGILGELSSGATKDSELRLRAEFVSCSSTGELRGAKKYTGGVVGEISWGVDYSIENCSGVCAPAAGAVQEAYPDVGYLFTEE